MVKDFYLVFSQRFNPTVGYGKGYWNKTNAMVVVETSKSRAIKKAKETGSWITKNDSKVNPIDILSCFRLDIKKYKTGDIVIYDFGDDG